MSLPLKIKNKLRFTFFLFCCLFMSSKEIYTQCAGTNNTVTICDKETDTNYQTFDLFSQLGGTPTTGGTWSADDPRNNFALNTSTGILNLWEITRFGNHSFTYTNNACNESAMVTIALGGYPGEDNTDGGANACSNNSAVDLFNYLDNNLGDLNSDTNGTWSAGTGTPTGFITENFFNAQAAGPGIYNLVYTVDAVGTCPERFSTILLEVHRAPYAGFANNIIVCGTNDLSSLTNVNLFDYLVGEDPNGIWEDLNGTGQITAPNDAIINIQEVYNNFGTGEYMYSYTVFPSHGICPEEEMILTVQIPEVTANFSSQNVCNGNDVSIDINHNVSDGVTISYDLTYEIIDKSDNTVAHTDSVTNIEIPRNDNTTTYQIVIPANTLASGIYTIRSSSIANMNIMCDAFEVSETDFIIYNPQIDIPDTCYTTNIINATISDVIDSQGNPFNGNITIDYTVTDTTSAEQITVTNEDINFSNGTGLLPIDFSSFPKQNNDYSINIFSSTDGGLDCLDTPITIRRVPDDISLNIDVNSSCNASNVEFQIEAPDLTNGQYTITYSIVNTDTQETPIQQNIVSAGGTSNVSSDLSNLPQGSYEAILSSTQNDTATPCRTIFDFEVSETFSIGNTPDKPQLDPNQSFCLPAYLPNTPTISDILVNSGENLVWYESEASNTPLPLITPLTDGEDYFVSATNLGGNCQDSERASVVVSFLNPQTITSSNTTPIFCNIENPTLANLEATPTTGTVVWYDSANGGNILTTETPLTNGGMYYAVENINGCEGTRLPYTANIVEVPTPQFNGSTDLCKLDEPLLSDIENEIPNTNNYQLVWYDSDSGGNTLNSSDLIEEGITYYATFTEATQNCESLRLPLTFSLNNCNTDDYDFFIPDGFSPNGDGVNDLYFIPNITYFYPDYSYEIVNRYGQLLFTGNKNNPKWDGTNASTGNKSTSGVYFYILYKDASKKTSKQGRIFLSK